MKLKTPRGTFDVLPEAAALWQEAELKARGLFSLYNYKEIKTPAFEDTALFVRGIGEATDIVEKEMYTFPDKKGRSLTLRPEGTAPIVRAFIEHNLSHGGGVVKLFYSGPFFRYERAQAGRQRQFYQFGAEALGSGSPAIDAEIISLAVGFLSALGINGHAVMLNNTGCGKCREEYVKKLVGYLAGASGKMCPDCERRSGANPLRVLDCKQDSCAGIRSGAPVIIDYACGECKDHFESVKLYLEDAGIDFKINNFLVRGLDYYTRTTFEVVHGGLGAQNALAGGGRYDGLVEQLGGKPTPAAGFACGLERIIMVLGEEFRKKAESGGPAVFAAYSECSYFREAYKLTQKLRRMGVSCDMDYQDRSLKAQMKLADKLGAGFAVIVSDGLILRDMSTGEQKEVRSGELEGFFLKRR